MFYQNWTKEQEQSLLDIFNSTEGTLWDKARETNRQWNKKDNGWYTKNLVTLVNKYHKIKV
jgi:hypothetical protein